MLRSDADTIASSINSSLTPSDANGGSISLMWHTRKGRH
jgi:hypothetical protein